MKVSICIPAYNQVYHLRQTLVSVLQQTFEEYEVVLSDDSPHGLVQALVNEFDFGGRLRYFHNDPPLGSPANWNFCISQAKGEYIKFLHHDDRFSEANSLEKFVLVLDSFPEVSFAFSSAQVYLEKEDSFKLHSPNHFHYIEHLADNPAVLFFGNLIGPPSSTIYRRSVGLRFDEHLKWLVDVDFYIRMLQDNRQYQYIDQPLVIVLADSDDSMTAVCLSDKNVELSESFYLYDKLKPVLRYNQLWKYKRYLAALLGKHDIVPQNLSQTGYKGRVSANFRLLLHVSAFYFLLKSKLRTFKNLIAH